MWEERLREENEYRSWEVAVTSRLAAQTERKRKGKAVYLLVLSSEKQIQHQPLKFKTHADTRGIKY